ncbi:hypothetical protein [Pseudorhodobacter sp.]|uniref:hypothetical protein n=1 Tax=Pseudorhodobacter sp. TaxID=1934400 RepID=UPI002648AD2F|nr:hypothetical protein [Pseudorhodobacter sp.]MDN5787604.1 hypothetical protein [Pseudorhodobacter sp.]
MADRNYIFASTKPWNIAAFMAVRDQLPGRWSVITGRDDLDPALIAALDPRYIFFPHWNWIVPKPLLERFECVCFHMTDVPYGRGGSPLQNLIARGHDQTKLTALRMSDVLDAGDVYAKSALSLAGAAHEIFDRAAHEAIKLLQWIVLNEPTPQPQSGEVTTFKRRTPDQSLLPDTHGLQAVYDHIRMLDAEGYPKAFLTHGGLRLEFADARFDDGCLTAQVSLTETRTKAP